jgi:hypothetical protein
MFLSLSLLRGEVWRGLKIIGRTHVTADCHQTWNKNPTPNPLPASDEGAKMYFI